MDFGDWVETSTRQWQMNPNGQRFGQFLFNSLHKIRPDLANQFRGSYVDPFYNDRYVGDFLTEVGLAW